MSVSVRIPAILRTYTGGSAEVSAEAGTFPAVSTADATYPGMGGWIVEDAGNLRRIVNGYMGKQDVSLARGLAAPAPAGAHVPVTPALAGG